MDKLFAARLRSAPRPFKVAALAYVLSLCLAYGFALIQVAFTVGVSPQAISQHYHGNPAPALTPPSGESEFSLDDTPPPPAQNPAGPSLKSLISLAHTHLFGMASFFFGLCLLGLLTGIPDGQKIMMVTLPWIALVLDNLSFFAIRLWGGPFALITLGAGGLMVLSFVWPSGTVLWELRQKK